MGRKRTKLHADECISLTFKDGPKVLFQTSEKAKLFITKCASLLAIKKTLEKGE